MARILPLQIFLLSLAGLLTACGSGDDADQASPESRVADARKSAQAEKAQSKSQAQIAQDAESIANGEMGTPLEERVAIIGLLNKRNNQTRDIEIKPGEAKRYGNVIVRLASCERTAPWEMPQETGAFVQVDVQRGGADNWNRIFSGWLFKNSPSLNVIEHPIYDVWVKDCKMRFPGDEAPVDGDGSSSDDDGGAAASSARSSAPSRPAAPASAPASASPSPAPAPSPAAPAPAE